MASEATSTPTPAGGQVYTCPMHIVVMAVVMAVVTLALTVTMLMR